MSHILLFAGYARNGINQVRTSACEVPFAIVSCGSCDRASDFPITVHVRTISAFLALLKRFAFRRGYALPNFCVVRLRRRRCRRRRCSRRRRKLLVQTLSPLKSMDQLASNFM